MSQGYCSSRSIAAARGRATSVGEGARARLQCHFVGGKAEVHAAILHRRRRPLRLTGCRPRAASLQVNLSLGLTFYCWGPHVPAAPSVCSPLAAAVAASGAAGRRLQDHRRRNHRLGRRAAARPAPRRNGARALDDLGKRYRANPSDAKAAIAYAQALRATDQRAQAVAVLNRRRSRNPHDMAVLGAYGRALADAGQYEQALDVLGRAHTPDNPDWRILNAQGAVLDQMGRHAEAQRHYATALKIVPNEPSVLSNLGLSYALAKELPQAEATLRQAAAQPDAEPKVRQNLALVVGLQGRFAEAEKIAGADLPPDRSRRQCRLSARRCWRSESRPENDGPAHAGADPTPSYPD